MVGSVVLLQEGYPGIMVTDTPHFAILLPTPHRHSGQDRFRSNCKGRGGDTQADRDTGEQTVASCMHTPLGTPICATFTI